MALVNPRLSKRLTVLQVSDKAKKAGRPKKEPVALSDYLWESTAGLRQKIACTYFVRGIKSGTLNPTAFGGYMVQDSVYCSRAKKSIDIAAGRATDSVLKEYLEHESKSYGEYADDLFKKWHISEADGIQLGEACLNYADYEESVAQKKDTIYFIMSMIPCMKLWPWLGQQIQGNHGVYTDWFNANFDPLYEGYKELDQFVDTAYENGTVNKEMALEVYTTCMQGEFNFFNGVQKMC